MWEPFLKSHDFSRRVEVMSFDDLRIRSDPDRPDREEFRQELDEYSLVVVDEAHNLRNPAAQRSAAVNALVAGANPKKVVLLTATPVNNSLMDLYTLVSYFVRNDAAFAGIGIPSIREYITACPGDGSGVVVPGAPVRSDGPGGRSAHPQVREGSLSGHGDPQSRRIHDP